MCRLLFTLGVLDFTVTIYPSLLQKFKVAVCSSKVVNIWRVIATMSKQGFDLLLIVVGLIEIGFF